MFQTRGTVEVRARRYAGDGWRGALYVPTPSGSVAISVDVPPGVLRGLHTTWQRLAAEVAGMDLVGEVGVDLVGGSEVAGLFDDLGKGLMQVAGPLAGAVASAIPGIGPVAGPLVGMGITALTQAAARGGGAGAGGRPPPRPTPPQAPPVPSASLPPIARSPVAGTMALPGTTGLLAASLHGAVPPTTAAPLLGGANALGSALHHAVSAPEQFGTLAPAVAGLLRTALRALDTHAAATLGDPAARAALRRARQSTERRVAHALRIAESLLQV
jgi:hypothetical protein